MDFAETAFAEQHEQQVPIVEDGVIVEATLVLVVNPLQFADVQVALALQLLHLQLKIAVLLLQSVLFQLQIFNNKSIKQSAYFEVIIEFNNTLRISSAS